MKSVERDTIDNGRGTIMKFQKTLVGIFSTLVALSTVGCGAEPGGANAGNEPELASTEQPLWGTYHGGGGGWAYSDQLNTTHDFSGYDMHCGGYVDNLKLETTDGIVGYNRQTGAGFGGPGGSDTGWQRCPAGQFIVGLYGRSGDWMDQLGFYCGTPDHSQLSQTPACGGSGGNAFDELCPVGQVMRNYWIRANSDHTGYLLGIEINCDTPYYGQIIY